MSKKCPPGIFCIENTTLIFLLIVFLLILGIIYFVNFNYVNDYKYLLKEASNRNNHQATTKTAF